MSKSRTVFVHRLQRRALHTLARRALERKHLKRAFHLVQSRRCQRCRAVRFREWARLASRCSQILQSCRVYMATTVWPRKQRTSFRAWSAVVHREQRYASVCQRARIVLNLSLKGRTMRSWHSMIQSKQHGAAKLLHLIMQCKLEVFDCWHTVMLASRKEYQMIHDADRMRS